jgi:hypothetical protein
MMQTVALPKQLEMMPLSVLAMLKSAVLRDGVDVRTDERISLAMAVGSFTVPQTIAYFLPSLFSLHTLTANGQNFGGVDGGRVVMPPKHPLTLEHMAHEGMYLVENGLVMMLWIGEFDFEVFVYFTLFRVYFPLILFSFFSFIWFLFTGKHANPMMLEQLLAVQNADRLDSVKINLQRLETDISYRVNNIVDTIRSARGTAMPLYVVRQVRFWGVYYFKNSFCGFKYILFATQLFPGFVEGHFKAISHNFSSNNNREELPSLDFCLCLWKIAQSLQCPIRNGGNHWPVQWVKASFQARRF